MVNLSSRTFKFSEKIGIALGRTMRYFFVGGIIVFIAGKLINLRIIPTKTRLNL